MTSITEGDWRTPVAITIWVGFAVLIGTVIFIDESCRLLILNNKLEETIQIINKAGRINSEEFQDLSVIEIEQLKNWKIHYQLDQINTWDKFIGIFAKERIDSTWRLLVFISLFNVVTLGLTFIVPFIFEEENNGYYDLLLTVLAEIPAIFILFWIIDVKKIGRINILQFTQITTIFVLIAIWQIKSGFIVQGVMLMKFLQRLVFATCNPIMVESYSTNYRVMANSVIHTTSKFIGLVTPFFIYDLYEETSYGIFLMFAQVILVTFIIMLQYPQDKTGQELDIQDIKSIHRPGTTEDNLEFNEEFDKLLQNNKEINIYDTFNDEDEIKQSKIEQQTDQSTNFMTLKTNK